MPRLSGRLITSIAGPAFTRRDRINYARPRTIALRGPAGLAILTLCLVLVSSLVPAGASAAERFEMDLYFGDGYERQIDGRTCTAAATAMMLNFIAHKDLDLRQRRILDYEQRHDALDDRVQRGSDPLGWSNALTHFADRTSDGITYAWEAYDSEKAALRRAARQLAATGMPVGLVIWHGRHAVVMTGFGATADPRRRDFKLTDVWISDSYGARHAHHRASESPLNRYRELDATRQYDKAWYGKYVIIVPQG